MCPYWEIFWSVYPPIWTECREMRSISPYQSECGKVRTRKAPNMYTFHAMKKVNLPPEHGTNLIFVPCAKATVTSKSKNNFILLFQNKIYPRFIARITIKERSNWTTTVYNILFMFAWLVNISQMIWHTTIWVITHEKRSLKNKYFMKILAHHLQIIM